MSAPPVMRERILRIFIAETVPAWLTVTFLIAGAVGTYLVTPLFNEHMNAESIKRDYIVKTLDGISERTRNLLAANSIVHQHILHAKPISSEQFDDAYRTIAGLQWDVISLTIIFADNETREIIGNYQQALFRDQVMMQEIQSSVPADGDGIAALIKKDTSINADVLTQTLRLSLRIAELAGVKNPQVDRNLP